MRKIDSIGSLLEITGDGIGILSHVLDELRWYLEGEEAQVIVLEGEVISGLYEGAYYISKNGYRTQIIEKLGFDPYPGTLNLKLKDEEIEQRKRIEKGPSIRSGNQG